MKANVDPLTASNSNPGSETKAKNTLSSALRREPAIGLKAAANEPKQPPSSLSTPSATRAGSMDTQNAVSNGLTSDEARGRLAKSGPNAMPDTSVHPLRLALEKFWAPVPWMLEAAIALELVLGKYVEAAIIALLLVFNAVLGLVQESRAQATLAALKSRLALTASVRRDGAWKTVPATDLVPGDLVKLSLGGVVAADVKLTGGEVLLDQSMLTGESVPIEAVPGLQTYAGALVRRGEAEAEVTATGVRTKFSRTAELVRTAHVVSTQQKAVMHVVRNLAAFNGGVIMLLVANAWYLKMPVAEIIPLVLTAILGSIPVALPATFTLASALGARTLAKLGVLPTRLSAVDEAASMVVLCADKTGTLTQNALTVTTVRPLPGFDEAHVLALATLASSDGGQDPVDGAIRTAAASKAVSDAPKLIKFSAFDPAKKMSEKNRLIPAMTPPQDHALVVCAKCGQIMQLVRTIPERGVFPELQVFACPSCGEVEPREIARQAHRAAAP
jgi:H+-transporting ATPase